MTEGCENITFPQLLLRTVTRASCVRECALYGLINLPDLDTDTDSSSCTTQKQGMGIRDVQCELFLHSTMYPFGLESESGNVIKQLDNSSKFPLKLLRREWLS